MQFDPVCNHEFSPDGADNALWQFRELIINLITLSSDFDQQRKIIGPWAVADEMAEDFYSYYTLVKNVYIEYGLLNNEQLKGLDQLDKFLEIKSGTLDDFWDDGKLESNGDWKVVRGMATGILKKLNMDDLEFEFDQAGKRIVRKNH